MTERGKGRQDRAGEHSLHYPASLAEYTLNLMPFLNRGRVKTPPLYLVSAIQCKIHDAKTLLRKIADKRNLDPRHPLCSCADQNLPLPGIGSRPCPAFCSFPSLKIKVAPSLASSCFRRAFRPTLPESERVIRGPFPLPRTFRGRFRLFRGPS